MRLTNEFVRSTSPSSNSKKYSPSRHAQGAATMDIVEKFWWCDLNISAAEVIIKSDCGKYEGSSRDHWNKKFRDAQPELRRIHAETFHYKPGYYSTVYYNKAWSAGALRKMPMSEFWDIMKTHHAHPDHKFTFNLREKIRDELKPGITKGAVYDLVTKLIDQFDADCKYADWDCEKDSPKKYRQGSASAFYDRKSLLLLRHLRYHGTLSTEAPSIDSESSSIDSESDAINAKTEPGTNINTGDRDCSPKIKAEVASASDTPLAIIQRGINWASADGQESVSIAEVQCEHYDYGHRMPPKNASAEYHQCFALCLAAVLTIPETEVKAQMKAVSMAFRSTAGDSYEDLPASHRQICELPAVTSSMVDVGFLRFFCLPCLRGWDVAVASFDPTSGTTNIDTYTSMPDLINDKCMVLYFQDEHFTVLRLPSRFSSVRDFVREVGEDEKIFVINHTIRAWYGDENEGFRTPDRRTSNQNAPQVKPEPNCTSKPEPHNKAEMTANNQWRLAAKKEDSEESSQSSPISLISESESDTERDADQEPGATATEPKHDHHDLLDATGPTSYNDKVKYMDHLRQQQQAKDSGYHKEHMSKVVDRAVKGKQMKEKGKKAASNMKSYCAGKLPKNLQEKALALTQMCKGE